MDEREMLGVMGEEEVQIARWRRVDGRVEWWRRGGEVLADLGRGWRMEVKLLRTVPHAYDNFLSPTIWVNRILSD